MHSPLFSVDGDSLPSASQAKASQASTTALNNEKKVDHTGIIVEVNMLLADRVLLD